MKLFLETASDSATFKSARQIPDRQQEDTECNFRTVRPVQPESGEFQQAELRCTRALKKCSVCGQPLGGRGVASRLLKR